MVSRVARCTWVIASGRCYCNISMLAPLAPEEAKYVKHVELYVKGWWSPLPVWTPIAGWHLHYAAVS